jgi:hypothetical protein
MAYDAGKMCFGQGLAAADLSTHQYKFVKYTSTGWNVAGLGEMADGVLEDKPEALGRVAQVALLGVVKVKAGAAVAKGALVMSDANGKAVTYVNDLDNVCLGRAVEAAGADGDIIPVIKYLSFNEDSGT